jgi:hypothetical protein
MPYVEVDMELSKKTTILFNVDLYSYLSGLARQRHVSLGYLVRLACERQYRQVPVEERVRAVKDLCKLSLPVGSPEEIEEESVPRHEALLP